MAFSPFEGKKITWIGEEGRFLTNAEYDQIIGAYNGMCNMREDLENQISQAEERAIKLQEANLRLRAELQQRVQGNNDYVPPRPPTDNQGKSLRAQIRDGEPTIPVRGSGKIYE